MDNVLQKIQKGLEYSFEKTVLPEDSAARYDSGIVDVFSTPAMIALMEGTAYRVVQEHLPDGFSTVGTEVHIKHLKATSIGEKVRCLATLIEIDKNKLTFEVKAWDEQGLIGEGLHQRYIIDIKKFIEKIKSL
jgi:fluoroacetyl-CoA thioesterase